uniref:Macaca fascicularis brain cDNA clone: QmoA-12126, similar to human KIAA0725 protein (KIAA0725), mRNA, RefSeq: XM_291291.3 n=1 Tax=Macaca fascicularis TaxID=9541 RepID=I7GJW5_MACFA|nr:unnamed protein product [Macaca fascicularis]
MNGKRNWNLPTEKLLFYTIQSLWCITSQLQDLMIGVQHPRSRVDQEL